MSHTAPQEKQGTRTSTHTPTRSLFHLRAAIARVHAPSVQDAAQVRDPIPGSAALGNCTRPVARCQTRSPASSEAVTGNRETTNEGPTLPWWASLTTRRADACSGCTKTRQLHCPPFKQEGSGAEWWGEGVRATNDGRRETGDGGRGIGDGGRWTVDRESGGGTGRGGRPGMAVRQQQCQKRQVLEQATGGRAHGSFLMK